MRYCYQGHSLRRGLGICFLLSLTSTSILVPGLFLSFCTASESFLPSQLPSQQPASAHANEHARGSGSFLTSTASTIGPLHTTASLSDTTTDLTEQIDPATSVSNDAHATPLHAQKTDNSSSDSGEQPLPSSLAVASLPRPTTRRHPILPGDAALTLLAFLAGISDYICFHRLQLFVIMQTGNLIHAFSSLIEGRWKEARNSGCVVAAYAIGSGIWRILSLSLSSSSAVLGAAMLALPLFYCCDTSTVLRLPTSIMAPIVLSLAFGLISSAATTVGGGIISFAYTGHISNAGKYVAERVLLRGRSFKRTPGTSIRLLLGFASGVVSSSLYHKYLLRPIQGDTRGTVAHFISRHPFFALGMAYATVLIFGGIDLFTSSSSGETETVAGENTNRGLEELISTKLKIRGIGKRRRRGDELDIRVDGWTNIHSGPRSFDDGS